MPTIVRPGAAHYRRGRSRLVLALLLVAIGCRREKEQTLPIETAAVTRRTIVSEATASGQVEPINVIEVKSKSSGQITEMTVETGSIVHKGQLLIQLDPRDVQQQLAQAEADLTATRAKLEVSKAQKETTNKMRRRSSPQEEWRTSSRITLTCGVQIRSRSPSISPAACRGSDERAPVAGTIIDSSVSQLAMRRHQQRQRGTILPKMADSPRSGCGRSSTRPTSEPWSPDSRPP
jgi:HlyD family secretion protein